MVCDNCKGNTYTISTVTGNEVPCGVCDSTGDLQLCDSFNPGKTVAVFRSTRCITCGVRSNNHVKVSA